MAESHNCRMGSCFRTCCKVALSCWFDFSRQNPFQLIVALSSTDEARGGLFYDDGESLGKRWPALKNEKRISLLTSSILLCTPNC